MGTSSTEDRLDVQEVAERMLDRYGRVAEAEGRPVWAMAYEDHEGRTAIGRIGADLLDGHPRDADLFGWTAPEWCLAVGAVGTGRVRPLADFVEPPARLRPAMAGGLRLASVVDRSGRHGWLMILPDGSPYDVAPDEGRMLDMLRRTLGLATAPPPRPVTYMHCIGWLSAVLMVAETRDEPVTWATALRMHPATWDLPEHATVAQLEACIRVSSRESSWEHARRTAAVTSDLDEHGPFPSPDLAEWMDEGMFARWVLGEITPLEEALEIVRPALKPTAGRRLVSFVRELGAPEPGERELEEADFPS